MEPLQTDTLYLAATRPTLFYGVPLSLAGPLIMLPGIIVVLLKNPLWLIVMVPIWFGARAIVARDYNAVGVWMLYLKTAGLSTDTNHWGGASVTPHPTRLKNRGRGMIHVR